MKVNKKNKNILNLKNVVLLIFVLLTGAIMFVFAQTAIVQTRYNKNLINYSNKTHQEEKNIEAWRGKILDRNGHELVSTRRSYDVVFQVKKYPSDNDVQVNWIKDEEKNDIATKVGKILNYDVNELKAKFNDKNVFQVEIGKKGKNLNLETKEKLDKLNNKGIHFTPTTTRFYQDPFLGSMLFGYTTKNDNNKVVGANGIEKYFDEQLSGKDGKETSLVDKDGSKLPHSKTHVEQPKTPNDIYLTIDQHIQSILEKEIDSGQKRNNANWVMGIITDAKTNKILGASASPGFNLDDLSGLKLFNSPIANDAYEPGSVMKVFTWANAIDKNRYNPNEKYNSGSIIVDNNVIKDHVEGGWGVTTYDQGFYRSSNVAAIKITQGSDTTKAKGYSGYLNFLKNLGFGSKTGVEIASEEQGNIPTYTSDTDVATTTFGQNILVTPMQIMKAMSVISSDDNGLYEPRIVEEIKDSKTQKSLYKYDINKIHIKSHVIKKQTADKMLDLLKNNVSGSDANKTGTNFKINNYDVGVKTGSAQIADDISKYSTSDNLMLLSGLSVAPVKNPKINVYIAMKRPRSGQWDIPTIYRPIVKDVLEYLGTKTNDDVINKDIKKVQIVHLPSLINMKVSEAKKYLDSYGFKTLILGNGENVLDQLPNDNENVYTNQTIILNTSEKKILPDFSKLSLREVKNIAKILDLNIEIKGDGYVYYQSFKPKYELKDNEKLIIKLK